MTEKRKCEGMVERHCLKPPRKNSRFCHPHRGQEKNPQQGVSELADNPQLVALRESADDSARHLRTLYFTFLLFTFYITIIVFSTTDEQLLLETPITLPLLGVAIPLLGFYAFAPWLTLIFHLHLLNQFYLLSRKLHHLCKEIRSLPPHLQKIQRELPFPFLFSHLIVGRHHPVAIKLTLAVAVIVTVIVVPIILLLSIQWQFLPYHHVSVFEVPRNWMSRNHQLAVLLDMLLLWIFWPRMTSIKARWQMRWPKSKLWWSKMPPASPRGGVSLKPPFLFHHNRATKHSPTGVKLAFYGAIIATPVIITFLFLVLISVDTLLPSFDAWEWGIYNGSVIAPLLFLLIIWIHLWMTWPRVKDSSGHWKDWGLVATRFLPLIAKISIATISTLTITLISFLIIVPPGDGVEHWANEDDQSQIAQFLDFILHRNLDLNGLELMKNKLAPELIVGWDRPPSQPGTAWRVHGEAMNLQYRDLRYASLRGATFRKANLEAAQLQHADLWNASLKGVKMNKETRLQGASLFNVNLQDADLSEVDLRSAKLAFAKLNGATLDYALLQHSNLENADLSNAILENAFLQDANLQRANLSNAVFESAYLQGARLMYSTIHNTKFAGAELSDADLQHSTIKKAQFSHANLEWADLRHTTIEETIFKDANLEFADLSNSYLKSTDFQRANLQYASIQYANLEDINFRGALLNNAQFQGTVFRNAELQGADLESTGLQGASLENAKLQGANLRFADLDDAFLESAHLQNAKLQGAQLHRTCLRNARLQGTNLQDAQLNYADLRGIRLKHTNLDRAQLHDVILTGTQLRGENLASLLLQGARLNSTQVQGTNFDGTQLQGTDFKFAQLQGAILRGADLRGANLEFAQLQGANLQDAQLQGANLRFAQLQGANFQGAKLQGADLRSATVYSTNFAEADLQLADLRGLASNPNAWGAPTDSFDAIEKAEAMLDDPDIDWAEDTRKRVREAISRFWEISFDALGDATASTNSQVYHAMHDRPDTCPARVDPPNFGEFERRRAVFLVDLSCRDEFIARAMITRVMVNRDSPMLAAVLLNMADTRKCPAVTAAVEPHQQRLKRLAKGQ